MGTGIMSILLHTEAHNFPGMAVIGTILYCANTVIFAMFLLISVAGYTLFPWTLPLMLGHSAQSLIVGTIPMVLATIVNATVVIAVPSYGQWATDLAWTLWWIDVVLSVLSTFGVPLLMFHFHILSLDKVTGAWLLPVVQAVVAVSSGGLVATVLPTSQAMTTLFVSYVLWGLGMSLSFMVLALYFHRLCVHKLPTIKVIVSAYLPLGPCEQGASWHHSTGTSWENCICGQKVCWGS